MERSLCWARRVLGAALRRCGYHELVVDQWATRRFVLDMAGTSLRRRDNDRSARELAVLKQVRRHLLSLYSSVLCVADVTAPHDKNLMF